jgi:transcriptional regulatory protein LevR
MKTRKEIESFATEHQNTLGYEIERSLNIRLIVELLLDIRELLLHPIRTRISGDDKVVLIENTATKKNKNGSKM